MNDDLNEVGWSLMDNMSLQEAWLFLYTIYQRAMDQFIPKSVPTKDHQKKAVGDSYSSSTTHKTKARHELNTNR